MLHKIKEWINNKISFKKLIKINKMEIQYLMNKLILVLKITITTIIMEII